MEQVSKTTLTNVFTKDTFVPISLFFGSIVILVGGVAWLVTMNSNVARLREDVSDIRIQMTANATMMRDDTTRITKLETFTDEVNKKLDEIKLDIRDIKSKE